MASANMTHDNAGMPALTRTQKGLRKELKNPSGTQKVVRRKEKEYRSNNAGATRADAKVALAARVKRMVHPPTTPPKTPPPPPPVGTPPPKLTPTQAKLSAGDPATLQRKVKQYRLANPGKTRADAKDALNKRVNRLPVQPKAAQ